MTELSGNLVLPNTIVSGSINFETTIQNIIPTKHETDRYILPGFIDGHIHGGDGADTMDGVKPFTHSASFMPDMARQHCCLQQLPARGLMLSARCRLLLKLPGSRFPMVP